MMSNDLSVCLVLCYYSLQYCEDIYALMCDVSVVQVLEDTRKQLLTNFCEIFAALTLLCGRHEHLLRHGRCLCAY